MKPAPVDYVAPRTVADAVAALADGGGGAKVLAGGPSPLPTMAMRLARPSLLGDVGRLPAGAFFETVFTTALAPDELLVAVDLPVPAATARSGFAEVSRRAGDFALVACAVLVELAGDVGGSVRRARVALGGVADRPVRCAAAEDALVGRALGAGVVEAAGAAAAAAVE